MKEKFYITTAIAYTSKKPHIGNTYEVILTDAIARYKRMRGYDVYFLTGTDEHGQKIQEAAESTGITPKEYVDKVAGEVKAIWDTFGATYDRFIRTTDDDHVAAVQGIFRKLYEQGDIYKGSYEGLYCTPCESFWTPSQLVDGKCPECGREVIKTSEEAYFLRLSKYADQLMKHIEENPDFIVPEMRKNEMVNNFLKPGLQDLCVSRSSFSWGVPVDFDDGHVIYVWVDALSNYITALGYTVDGCSEKYKKLWPADVHVVGKDIVRFHTIYWPIILLALGEPLPKKVLGHPWLLSGTDKMSKSRGNVLYGDDLAKQFGVDVIRYYLLSEMGFTDDGTITYENIIKTTNADLANVLGNLVNRTAAMIKQYFGGVIPEASEKNSDDDELFEQIDKYFAKALASFDEYKVADALKSVLEIFKCCNKYIDVTTPWVLAKDPEMKERLGSVMHNLVDGILRGAKLMLPIIPESAKGIFKIYGVDVPEEFSDDICFSGNVIDEVPILFARIDEKKMLSELMPKEDKKAEKKEKKAEEKAQKKAEKKEEEAPSEIEIGDFMKVKLTVGEILECEKVEKSDKLLKLLVDIGTEKRQVVSGIAKFYEPNALIGKKIVLVSNLKPAKLRGVDSNGMILCSGEEDVRIVEIASDVPNGTGIR